MARRKGRSTRGKSRVSQAPMGHTGRESWGTYVVLDLMESTVTDHCPWCVLWGVEPQPSGRARGTERAAVGPVPPDTV